jgi:dTDP-4-dehydrorhamnose 3,5-epimerase
MRPIETGTAADLRVKDAQTVTEAGERIGPEIDGVVVRPLSTLADERGEICELYRPSWGVHPDPLVHAYLTSVRPGFVKGWVMHERQDDRIACLFGRMRWVLFDGREESRSAGVVMALTITERNRALLTIPAGVWHAVENAGESDAAFVNLPTRPYDHADPDKYRLPLDTDAIPFRFERPRGW